ncbi:trypco2 family protein [Kitasatospora sp. NPDC006697]|uniref:trypco2 family protein n=1 Tax=Kitasatospora sp. NPDC006697 TaxID=3364020 RepID=UPI0036792B97
MTRGGDSDVDIELADAVAAVRDELLKAQSRGASSDLGFEVGPIEMEFEVELRADAKAAGKFRVWAVSAEAEAGVSRGRTHRVSFTLTPKLRDGGELLIHGSPDALAGPGDLSEHQGR